jgi:hypothetical protein
MKQNVQHIVCYSNIGNIRHELFAIGNNSLHQKQKKKRYHQYNQVCKVINMDHNIHNDYAYVEYVNA